MTLSDSILVQSYNKYQSSIMSKSAYRNSALMANLKKKKQTKLQYLKVTLSIKALSENKVCIKTLSDSNCSDPRARPEPIGGSEPKPWGRSVTTISLYQNHLSKIRESDFNLGQAHKPLQIQCNSFTKYAFNQK